MNIRITIEAINDNGKVIEKEVNETDLDQCGEDINKWVKASCKKVIMKAIFSM